MVVLFSIVSCVWFLVEWMSLTVPLDNVYLWGITCPIDLVTCSSVTVQFVSSEAFDKIIFAVEVQVPWSCFCMYPVSFVLFWIFVSMKWAHMFKKFFLVNIHVCIMLNPENNQIIKILWMLRKVSNYSNYGILLGVL